MNYLYEVLKILNLEKKIIQSDYISPSFNNSNRRRVKSSIRIISEFHFLYILLLLPFIFFIYKLFPIIMMLLSIVYLIPSPVSTFLDNMLNVNEVEKLLAVIVITIAVVIFSIIYYLIRLLFLNYHKKREPVNINLYNRELPDKLTPAHVRLLVFDGKIDSSTIGSTILDLIDRGYLELASSNREKLFTNNLKIRVTDKEQSDLFDYEKYLISWLFSNRDITSIEMKNKLNSVITNPCENFAIFQGLILLSFPFKTYYTKEYINKNSNIIINLFIFIINLLFIKSVVIYLIFSILLTINLIDEVFKTVLYRLNNYGIEIKDKYLDLKRYLIDFSNIGEKTSEMIKIWNFYLSYSVALDIDGIAKEEINNFFEDDIYNKNNDSTLSNQELSILINNIPEVVDNSINLYNNRKYY